MEPHRSGELSLDAIMREVREELDRRPLRAAEAAPSIQESRPNFLTRTLTRIARAIGVHPRRA
jgi:hypothetical protein